MGVYTVRMEKKKKKKSAWQVRLKTLQIRLERTNAEMGELLGVPLRAWIAWKYGERNPSKAAIRLLELAEQGKI